MLATTVRNTVGTGTRESLQRVSHVSRPQSHLVLHTGLPQRLIPQITAYQARIPHVSTSLSSPRSSATARLAYLEATTLSAPSFNLNLDRIGPARSLDKKVKSWVDTQVKIILNPPEAMRTMGHTNTPAIVLTLCGQGSSKAVAAINRYGLNDTINTAWREKALKPLSDTILSKTGFSLRQNQVLLRLGMTRNGMVRPDRTLSERKEIALAHVDELRLEASKVLAHKLEKETPSPNSKQQNIIAELKTGNVPKEEVQAHFSSSSPQAVETFVKQVEHADDRLSALFHTLSDAAENELTIGKDQAISRFAHISAKNTGAWIGLSTGLSAVVSGVSGIPLSPEVTSAICFGTKGLISFSANKYRQHSEKNQEKSGFYTTPTDTESHDWLKFFLISSLIMGLRSTLSDDDTATSKSTSDDTKATHDTTPETSEPRPLAQRAKDTLITGAYLTLSLAKGAHLFSRIAIISAGTEATRYAPEIKESASRAAEKVSTVIEEELTAPAAPFSIESNLFSITTEGY